MSSLFSFLWLAYCLSYPNFPRINCPILQFVSYISDINLIQYSHLFAYRQFGSSSGVNSNPQMRIFAQFWFIPAYRTPSFIVVCSSFVLFSSQHPFQASQAKVERRGGGGSRGLEQLFFPPSKSPPCFFFSLANGYRVTFARQTDTQTKICTPAALSFLRGFDKYSTFCLYSQIRSTEI